MIPATTADSPDATAAQLSRAQQLLLIAVVLFASVAVVVAAIQSPTLTRKMLMSMTAPVSACWVGVALCLLSRSHRRRRYRAACLGFVLLVVTVCGNGWVAHWSISRLERDYYAFDAAAMQPVDVLFVLGGGLGTRRNGTPQLNRSGDRVVLAACLYHQGKAKRLVTSGDPIPELGYTNSAANATAELWQQLGVPAESIICSRGTSTSEEMQYAHQLIQEMGAERVGLVTSAWHMPRAIRNARRHGVPAVPVPADFWSDGPTGPWQLAMIPSADALATTHRALLEFVGMAVGR